MDSIGDSSTLPSETDVNNNYPNYDLYNAWDAFEPEAQRSRDRGNTSEKIEYAPNLYSSVNFTNRPVRKVETRYQSPQPRSYGRDSMAQYGFYEDDVPPYAGMEQKPKARLIAEEPIEPPRPKTVKVGMIVCRNNVENDKLYAENVNRDLGEGFGMAGMEFGAMGFNDNGGGGSDYAADINQDTGYGMGGMGFDFRGSNNRRVYNRGMAFPHQTTQSLIPEPGNDILQAVHETIQADRSIPKQRLSQQNIPTSSTSAPAQNVKRGSNMATKSAKASMPSTPVGYTKKVQRRESRNSQEIDCKSPPRKESGKRNARSPTQGYIRSYNNPTRSRMSSSVPREAVYSSNSPVIQANYNPRRHPNKNSQNSKDKKPGLLWRGLAYPFKAIGISK